MRNDEESSITGYLVKNLGPLTEADPVILAEYVTALLKKDKPMKELQKLCIENLVDFLGQGTKPFVTKLFQALEDGSIVKNSEDLETIKQAELSTTPITVDPVELGNSTLNMEKIPTSSGSNKSDPEEKDFSDDDDDDDRNHKHRRRDSQSQNFINGSEELLTRKPTRKRKGYFENGQIFHGNDPQSGEIQRQSYVGPSDKLEKRHLGTGAVPRGPFDLGQRARPPQTFRSDSGTRMDSSTSYGRPLSKGRGRSGGPWSQQDLRFNSIDTLDLATQMAAQGPAHHNLFVGSGLPSAAGTQSMPWGAFNFIPGMPNGGLDPLNALGLPGPLHPPFPSLTMGMPRQRCRDFEERGFCLRGDMCPMEHGLNRIVVEDVQSLSQFNLPVSIPNTHATGNQTGKGSMPPVSASPSLLMNNKSLPSRISKSASADDIVVNAGVSASDIGGETDVYDPDQPLWNNDRPNTSGALLRLPSPKVDDTESVWADPSDQQIFRPSDSIDSEHLDGHIAGNVSTQNATESVWGRIGSGKKVEMKNKIDNSVSAIDYLGKETRRAEEEPLTNIPGSSHQRQSVSQEVPPTFINSVPLPKLRSVSARNVGKMPQKALRTLFVNGIPLKTNKREALLSHFQKFGEVIDIYIPHNSEKAFVQFQKREEAEAALKAPDAVMGNRFIKLWWANRDSIPSEGEGSMKAVPVASHGGLMTSALCSPISDKGKQNHFVASKGKDNLPSAVSKETNNMLPDVPVPASVPPKNLASNSPKVTLSSQKKLELELLKEELRKKQEELDLKRNKFRRQLDELEKQVAALKEHFSSFSDLSAIVLEEPEIDPGDGVSNPSAKCSARVTFTTRRSAEKAFLNGKCWQGHNLQFMWVTSSSSSSNEHGIRDVSPCPILTPKQPPDMEMRSEPLSGSSSVGAEKSSGVGTQAVSETGNREPVNVMDENDGTDCMPLQTVEACQSSPPPAISLYEKRPHNSNGPVIEDGLNVGIAQ
ncbi:Zinc finger CCCH domain-containing protein 27 [Acorus calamus]|uniref:Zinc finger CCCH domain-containing protein 27 n=1 Tax=Acorus calamus TaxID=4465 RepID=A0AAV9D9R2_ACOCL|nr:Zinc finger CCCH domain-containing protein 27 [Acorus calamus]